MTTSVIRVACAVTVLALVAACAAPPSANRNPRTVALILSGNVVSYSSPGFGDRVSIVDVDGKPVTEAYGPVEIAPGRHTVTLACDGTNTPHTLTFKAGEVYQFVVRTTTGGKGCVAALSRVRSTNP